MARVKTKAKESKNPWGDEPYFPRTMGFRPDITDEQYLRSHSYVSSHKIMSWSKEKAEKGSSEFFGGPQALEIGTLLHAMVLTPHELEEIESTRCTNLTDNDRKKAKMMAKAVLSNTKAVELLEGTTKELAMYYTGQGLKIRGKADAIHLEKKYIVDVKTAADVRNFKQAIRDFRYGIQAAFYLQIANLITDSNDFNTFFWIVVDKYKGAVKIVECPQAEILSGNAEISAFFAAKNDGSNWPEYQPNPLKAARKRLRR